MKKWFKIFKLKRQLKKLYREKTAVLSLILDGVWAIDNYSLNEIKRIDSEIKELENEILKTFSDFNTN